MNIVDIVIIAFIILSGVVGAKRGFFKEIVLCVGTILVFYFAYKFKDPIGEFLLLRMPMFDFPNLFKGVIVLNVLVYQLLSFIVVLAVLLIIFNVIISITGLFEKLLKITFILGLPSKILGFVLGLVEGYVITFVVLFFLTQPAFSFKIFMESNLSTKILNSSPVLTNITNDTVTVVENIYDLKDETDTNVLNNKILDMMLAKKIVKPEIIETLHNQKKIDFEGIETILEKYKGE